MPSRREVLRTWRTGLLGYARKATARQQTAEHRNGDAPHDHELTVSSRLMDHRSSATCSIDPGPVPGKGRSRHSGRRSHIGCPRSVVWLSFGLRDPGVARTGEAQEGFAQLEVAVPSRSDNHVRTWVGRKPWRETHSEL